MREMSAEKNEPAWMLEKRLLGLKKFLETSLPLWGPSLTGLDLQKIAFFVAPNAAESRSWEDVPVEIRDPQALVNEFHDGKIQVRVEPAD